MKKLSNIILIVFMVAGLIFLMAQKLINFPECRTVPLIAVIFRRGRHSVEQWRWWWAQPQCQWWDPCLKDLEIITVEVMLFYESGVKLHYTFAFAKLNYFSPVHSHIRSRMRVSQTKSVTNPTNNDPSLLPQTQYVCVKLIRHCGFIVLIWL